MSEVRYAIRQLLKSPGFTLVAILGLALGIGANVAFFSVVNSVFLRPLPYREPDRLVRLSSTNEAQNLTRVGFSYSRYVAVQDQQQVFSDLALSIGNPFTLTGRGDPEQLIGLQASAGLLPALGLQPAIGRSFSPAEDPPGGQHVVLISHAMWQQRFNRDPSVLGQALTLDGAPYVIIGVLRGRNRVPAESASDLGPAARRSAIPGSIAVERRRLLLSSHRAAAAGRVAGAGARRDERCRRQLPRHVSRQRRRAVAHRRRAAPG